MSFEHNKGIDGTGNWHRGHAGQLALSMVSSKDAKEGAKSLHCISLTLMLSFRKVPGTRQPERFTAAVLPRLSWNNIPGPTSQYQLFFNSTEIQPV